MSNTGRHRLSLLDIATLVLTSVLCAVAVWIALRGPTGPIPVHFGIDGQPDRWGPRSEIAAVIGLMALLSGAIAGGFGFAAAKAGDMAQKRSHRIGQFVILVTTGIVALLIVQSSLGIGIWTQFGGARVPLSISLILVLIGAVLGRVSPNPFVGVRTPWTFKSRLAWDRSNRLGGRLLFWTGLAGLVLTPIVPTAWATTLLIGLILGIAALTVFESWRVWRDDPDRQPF